ncbi:hypothetical protein LINPERPRIM_LOCUS31033 [Linum perenne]
MEFPSEKLCNWVIQRSWHVHHMAMVLRKWYVGIQPMDLTEKPAPVWITFEKVPPQLITVEGISWLASQLGKPVNRYIREGLTVKVCVYLNSDVKDGLSIVLGEEMLDIVVKYPKVRQFGKTTAEQKEWRVKDPDFGGYPQSDP